MGCASYELFTESKVSSGTIAGRRDIILADNAVNAAVFCTEQTAAVTTGNTFSYSMDNFIHINGNRILSCFDVWCR